MTRFRDGGPYEQIAGYSRGAREGQLIAVSGTTAHDLGGDAYEQTGDALQRALAAVVELGGRREDVIRTRLFLVTGCDWEAAVRAHREAFEGVDPANTTLFVSGLIPPGALVEVEVDAIVPASGV
jgi:enamine deaminase RidA (YjgF/YER057c/UK114 family)